LLAFILWKIFLNLRINIFSYKSEGEGRLSKKIFLKTVFKANPKKLLRIHPDKNNRKEGDFNF